MLVKHTPSIVKNGCGWKNSSQQDSEEVFGRLQLWSISSHLKWCCLSLAKPDSHIWFKVGALKMIFFKISRPSNTWHWILFLSMVVKCIEKLKLPKFSDPFWNFGALKRVANPSLRTTSLGKWLEEFWHFKLNNIWIH